MIMTDRPQKKPFHPAKDKHAPNVRRLAMDCLHGVIFAEKHLDDLLVSAASKADPKDKALLNQLVMLVLRRRGGLRKVLRSVMTKSLDKTAERIQIILELGAAQILLMDISDHAAVDEAVKLVKKIKGPESRLSGLVNALLRRLVREKGKHQKTLQDNPLWDLPAPLAKRWTHAWGPETVEQFALSLRQTPPTDISLNISNNESPAAEAKIWAEKLGGQPLPNGSVRTKAGQINHLEGFAEGRWWVQDVAASLPAQILAPKPNDILLDMCAAPGGKTMQLAAMGAQVTALDRSAKRLEKLSENLDRTGLSATVVTADALNYLHTESPSDNHQAPRGVDGILLDAPCSATGTFRRNPDGMWQKPDSLIKDMAALQKDMLDHSVTLLKDGGSLVYCVCSLEPEEGEQQWDAFLKRHTTMKAVPIDPAQCGGWAKGLTAAGTLRLHPGLRLEKSSLDPDMSVSAKKWVKSQGLDGFFIAKAIKAGNSA